jgi:hypothetical protein
MLLDRTVDQAKLLEDGKGERIAGRAVCTGGGK